MSKNNSISKITTTSISIYKDINEIQKNHIHNSSLEIRLPSFNFNEFVRYENSIRMEDLFAYAYFDNNGNIKNIASIIKDQHLASNNSYSLYWQKKESRIIMYNKNEWKETNYSVVEKPAGYSIFAKFVGHFIIVAVSSSESMHSKIYIYDFNLILIKDFEVFNYAASFIYCLNKYFIIDFFGKNYNRLLFFLDENFSLIVKRHLHYHSIASLFNEDNLIIKRYWLNDECNVYNWKTDEIIPIQIPHELIVKNFDYIKFYNNRRYAINLNSENTLQRFTLKHESGGQYCLRDRIILDENVKSVTYNNPEGYISYLTADSFKIKTIDTLETINEFKKENKIWLNQYFIKELNDVGKNDKLTITNFHTNDQDEVIVPKKLSFRTSFLDGNFLYFSFEEKGIGRFDFTTGAVLTNFSYLRIRQIRKFKNNLICAAWDGLFELNSDLELIHKFPSPHYVERGSRVFIYNNLVVYAGYGEKKLTDNFILIYDENRSVIKEIIEMESSNAFSFCCYLAGNFFYYITSILQKKIIVAFDLDKMEHLELQIEVNNDYRDIIVEKNYLYGATFPVGNPVKNYTYLDIIDLNLKNQISSIKIDNSRVVIGFLKISADLLILNFENTGYYIFKIFENTLEFFFEIKDIPAYFDAYFIPGSENIIILPTRDKLVFFDFYKRKVIMEFSLFGENPFFVTDDKWFFVNDETLLSVVKKDINGLEEFLPVGDLERNKYFKVYNSLDIIRKIIFNPQEQSFNQMRADYMMNKNNFPKMLE